MVFFDIEKAYDKVNREKTFEQLENMGKQGRMMEFIRELIGERWIKVRVGGSISQSKHTDSEISQRRVLSVTIFLVTRSQRVESKTLQGVINKLVAWAAKRGLTFSPSNTVSMPFRKRNEELIEIML